MNKTIEKKKKNSIIDSNQNFEINKNDEKEEKYNNLENENLNKENSSRKLFFEEKNNKIYNDYQINFNTENNNETKKKTKKLKKIKMIKKKLLIYI
jgi:hypothetical protein